MWWKHINWTASTTLTDANQPRLDSSLVSNVFILELSLHGTLIKIGVINPRFLIVTGSLT